MEKQIVSIIVTLFVVGFVFNAQGKVEKILKGSLDSIPSPSLSVKIQIMGGKVCLRCKCKTLLGLVNKQHVFLTQVKFPANNLNFH